MIGAATTIANSPATMTQAKRSAFAERFERLLREHGENQTQAAFRLGKTPGYISQLVRGLGTPSSEFLDQIIEAYGLQAEREEWRALCGFGRGSDAPAVDSDTDALLRRLADEAVRRAVEEMRLSPATLTPPQRLGLGITELGIKYDIPDLTVRNYGGWKNLSHQDVDRILREVEDDILAEQEELRQEAERKAKGTGKRAYDRERLPPHPEHEQDPARDPDTS